MKNCFSIGLFALGLVAFVGCSEAVDEVTNTVNCNDVCERYQTCFEPDYDVEGCTDRCEDEADANADREERLERCNACIDDRSCASGAFNCADECVGIVL